MVSMRLPLLTVEDFLQIDFGPDLHAELDNGVIRIREMGTASHARVSGNILVWLATNLRGTGFAAYGSSFGVRTHDMSLRYPNVSLFFGRNGPEYDDDLAFDDPTLVVEVMSPTTAAYDTGVKLDEYRALSSVEALIFVDPITERIRVLHRTGPQAWTDAWIEGDTAIDLPTLKLRMPLSEVFSRD